MCHTQLTIIEEEDGEEYLQRRKRAVKYHYGMIQHKGGFRERQMPIVLHGTLGSVENDMSNIISTSHRVCLNECAPSCIFAFMYVTCFLFIVFFVSMLCRGA